MAGDRAGSSFNEIYNSFYRKAFLFAKSYVHDDWVAEDIASDALIKLWEKMKEEDIPYVRPFLLAILKNKSLDYLKHEEIKRNVHIDLTDWHVQELNLRISTLEACNPDTIFSEEIKQIIKTSLDTVPEQTRKIFMMSRFQNKSNREIAESMGISVKGVDYHISKVLKILRVSLKDYLPILSLLF